MDQKTKQLRLNLRNWECGVVIPVMADSITVTKSDIRNNALDFDTFKGHVPIPMVVDIEGQETLKYGSRRPWFFV